MFASTFRVGKRAAAVIRLMQSTRKNAFDSYAYLFDVMAHLPKHRVNQIGELPPHRWLSTCQRPLKRLRPRVRMGLPRIQPVRVRQTSRGIATSREHRFILGVCNRSKALV